jgi:hypothetical protein
MAAMHSYVAPSGTRLREAASFNQSVERTVARPSVWTVTEIMNTDLQSVGAPPAPVAHLYR